MRKILIMFSCVALAFAFAGCTKKSPKAASQPAEPNKVASQQWDPNAVWDGNAPAQDAMPDFFEGQPAGGAFPEIMVGVWGVGVDQANDSKWGFKFEKDGSINKKIIHSFAGEVDAKEGFEKPGPDEGTYFVVSMGPCDARYIPKTRTIKVKVVVNYFIMQLPVGKLEGRIEDYIEGPVSEDGKTWNAKWWNFGWVKGATMPDIDLIKANPETLEFTKVDPNEWLKKDKSQ
jgi:hypothetical protein